MISKLLTQSALLDLLCRNRNPKYRENLDHYPNDCIHHFGGWRHFCVDFKTSEKTFDALECIDKRILASPNILNCL